ncbi:hypothetical protein MVLG_03863 [Microbotryum lychnidis-dioicae p1A1 Lamole]|uniref:Amino acid transporter transmembrane domain-containing protein n=1 Tax=Microbotryum lychnidis-dioicae (strain p1A1 Lamole / MvSl-1064) TaxID=683840 RepID=U5H9H2_USTV1|nr:hypothetical protein MVLG_03863 [Microbotryum lychnidis-dioicae p1A1 Lamole]|eukprot:KDE05772.1 hypothetical protein MVLG_03863 [Microbotryum lychnidis-dioicae p1A1 Lamole]
MIFPEIIAEMRRPYDAIKGIACAQIFVFTVYLFYGIFIHCFQGQYTLPLAYQGAAKYAWQCVGNGIALATVTVAAGLYANVGLKVVYSNIVEGLFKGSSLMTRKGQMIYPHAHRLRIDSWSNFSRWKRGLLAGGNKRLIFKLFNLVFFIGALGTGGLSMWGTGTALAQTIKAGAASSFGCAAPVFALKAEEMASTTVPPAATSSHPIPFPSSAKTNLSYLVRGPQAGGARPASLTLRTALRSTRYVVKFVFWRILRYFKYTLIAAGTAALAGTAIGSIVPVAGALLVPSIPVAAAIGLGTAVLKFGWRHRGNHFRQGWLGGEGRDARADERNDAEEAQASKAWTSESF